MSRNLRIYGTQLCDFKTKKFSCKRVAAGLLIVCLAESLQINNQQRDTSLWYHRYCFMQSFNLNLVALFFVKFKDFYKITTIWNIPSKWWKIVIICRRFCIFTNSTFRSIKVKLAIQRIKAWADQINVTRLLLYVTVEVYDHTECFRLFDIKEVQMRRPLPFADFPSDSLIL